MILWGYSTKSSNKTAQSEFSGWAVLFYFSPRIIFLVIDLLSLKETTHGATKKRRKKLFYHKILFFIFYQQNFVSL